MKVPTMSQFVAWEREVKSRLEQHFDAFGMTHEDVYSLYETIAKLNVQKRMAA